MMDENQVLELVEFYEDMIEKHGVHGQQPRRV